MIRGKLRESRRGRDPCTAIDRGRFWAGRGDDKPTGFALLSPAWLRSLAINVAVLLPFRPFP